MGTAHAHTCSWPDTTAPCPTVIWRQLSLWKYPSLVKVAEMTGHQGRVLHMATSPDGSSVVTAGADETLRCVLEGG